MKATVEIPKDADGWINYSPVEFVGTMVSDQIEHRNQKAGTLQVTFADVRDLTVSDEVIGISLPSEGYTMPHAEFISLKSITGAEATLLFPDDDSATDFAKNIEFADKQSKSPLITLHDVAAIDSWGRDRVHGGLAVSFTDETGYTAPGWVYRAVNHHD